MKTLYIIITFSLGLFMFNSCQELVLGKAEENTPINNFEVLWTDFDQHYALFDIRNRNWDSIYSEFRPRINNEMTDEEFWVQTTDMLEYLDETHTFIYNPYTKEFFESGSTLNAEAEELFSLDLIKDRYLSNYTNLSTEAEFAYGKIKDKDIGYIYLDAMDGSDPALIDEIMAEIKDHKAIILDIRLNGGGSDLFSARVAGAFADKEAFIYTVQNRNGPNHDDFEEKRPYYTKAIGDVYEKPVIVLTDRYTVSAAEIFLLHMKAFDLVTQIGDITSGDFSDVSNGRFLPNGWYYGYSIQKFLLPDGKSLDGIGHVPDILIQNTVENLENNEDKVLERAFDFLFEEYGIN